MIKIVFSRNVKVDFTSWAFYELNLAVEDLIKYQQAITETAQSVTQKINRQLKSAALREYENLTFTFMSVIW